MKKNKINRPELVINVFFPIFFFKKTSLFLLVLILYKFKSNKKKLFSLHNLDFFIFTKILTKIISSFQQNLSFKKLNSITYE
jgi:ABC-type antimicrobial peptide transport system permease subunit